MGTLNTYLKWSNKLENTSKKSENATPKFLKLFFGPKMVITLDSWWSIFSCLSWHLLTPWIWTCANTMIPLRPSWGNSPAKLCLTSAFPWSDQCRKASSPPRGWAGSPTKKGSEIIGPNRSWEHLIETTNPHAFFQTHVEEGFLQNNEKRTGDAGSHWTPLLQNTLGWHSSWTILWDTLLWHSSGILLWDTFVGHSCETFLPDTFVAHSGKTLSLNTLKRSWKTLWLDTLAWHIWNTSQYYFVLQTLRTVPHSTTLFCKPYTE